MANFTNRTFDEIDIGTSESVSQTLTGSDVESLAVVSGDVDAYHVRPDSGDRLHAQGAASVAMVAALINRRLPGPGSAIRATDFRYSGALYVGDVVTATVTAQK